MSATKARLHSVNVVHALVPDGPGDLEQTAIDKRPVAGRRQVGSLGVVGDRVVDTRHHGGLEQAVYVYAREDAAWWSAQLGREVRPGQFGENFSTEGVDVTGAVIGEKWRIGDDGLLVQVATPRIPCRTFQGWMDEPHWVRRFTEHGAPGAYLRVLAEGSAAAGDEVEVVHRPAHGVTIGDVFLPRQTDSDRLRLLLDEPSINDELAAVIERDLEVRVR